MHAFTAHNRRAICIFGPTAAGKTAVSLALAAHYSGEIINADSRQIYQEMPIITAMPTAEEFAAVPHHLFSFLSPVEVFSVKGWLTAATQKAQELWQRGKTPIFVGGTGLYFRVLEYGLSAIPPIPEERLIALLRQLEGQGAGPLYARLQQVDPAWAASINAGDTQRILRGLSVFDETGTPLSLWQQKPREGGLKEGNPQGIKLQKYALSPPAAVLRERIHKRYASMRQAGVLEEAASLFKKYGALTQQNGEIAPAFKSIGLGSYSAYFEGKITQEQAHNEVLTQMYRYSKRQRTWLRNSFGESTIFETAEGLIGAATTAE